MSRRNRSGPGLSPIVWIKLHAYTAACTSLLVLSLVAGGASQQNAIPAGLVEMAALALLPWSLYRTASAGGIGAMRAPLAIIAVLIFIPVAQLIPLPPPIWTHLPSGPSIVANYEAAHIHIGLRPMTLEPMQTIRSALALIPGIVCVLAWSTVGYHDRRIGVAAVLVVVLLSLLLGAVQLAGNGSLGYLYAYTNNGSLVGFFSNRNHEASLLLSAIPLTAGLLGGGRKGIGRAGVIIALAFSLTVIVALAAVKSRAGIGLVAPAILGGYVIIARSAHRSGSTNRVALALGLLLVVAISLVAWFGLGPLIERFGVSVADDIRFTAAPTIWKAALHYAPWGTGLGSFDAIYRSVEPFWAVQYNYLNHAHDDYLEIFLCAGMAGVIGVAGFILWFLLQQKRIWLREQTPQLALAQSAAVVILILLLHSTLDYPLRTIALSSMLGFSCALLIRPLRQA